MMDTNAVATISLLLLSDDNFASRDLPNFFSPFPGPAAGADADGMAAARSPAPGTGK